MRFKNVAAVVAQSLAQQQGMLILLDSLCGGSVLSGDVDLDPQAYEPGLNGGRTRPML